MHLCENSGITVWCHLKREAKQVRLRWSMLSCFRVKNGHGTDRQTDGHRQTDGQTDECNA